MRGARTPTSADGNDTEVQQRDHDFRSHVHAEDIRGVGSPTNSGRLVSAQSSDESDMAPQGRQTMLVRKFRVYFMRKGERHYESLGECAVSVSDDRRDAWLDGKR